MELLSDPQRIRLFHAFPGTIYPGTSCFPQYNYSFSSHLTLLRPTPPSLTGNNINYHPPYCSSPFNGYSLSHIANNATFPSYLRTLPVSQSETFQSRFPITSSPNRETFSRLSTPKTVISESLSSTNSSRPFTAYPFPCPLIPSQNKNYSSTEAYEEFREKVLSQFKTVSAKRRGRAYEDDKKDLKRRKNNEAARKSREARRVMEDEIAIRCAFLERENDQIRAKLVDLEMEAKTLERQLLNR
ncbi:cell death specification protein 2-like [Anoplophora glabripennis]|uniref:cell death specification protein 2-like n=1 Tax=Anoplophora glabripennis TaxID=217634 RepID=UPI0008759A38|nr:cell death specification protein 2-like [Anoplophora glabripennis]